MHEVQVAVLAKQPLAGRVKTRLCPPLTPEQAAQVARAALLDTLAAVTDLGVRRRVVVLDGDPTDLVPVGFDVLPQCEGALDLRLAAAVTEAFATCPLPLLLIGMDTPQVNRSLLDLACHELLRGDCVLGLAEDGGWWAIGLHAPDPGAFVGVPMSRSDTGAQQLDRLAQRGIVPTMLPVLRDIDRVDDLVAVVGSMSPSSYTRQVVVTLRTAEPADA